jgi:hypothetical protein
MTRKERKPITPCLVPGNYYFVDDLIEGGLAGQNKFTEWYSRGLKPLALGTRRYVVCADDIIALGREGLPK